MNNQPVVGEALATLKQGGNGSNQYTKSAKPSAEGLAPITASTEQVARRLGIGISSIERVRHARKNGIPEIVQAVATALSNLLRIGNSRHDSKHPKSPIPLPTWLLKNKYRSALDQGTSRRWHWLECPRSKMAATNMCEKVGLSSRRTHSQAPK